MKRIQTLFAGALVGASAVAMGAGTVYAQVGGGAQPGIGAPGSPTPYPTRITPGAPVGPGRFNRFGPQGLWPSFRGGGGDRDGDGGRDSGQRHGSFLFGPFSPSPQSIPPGGRVYRTPGGYTIIGGGGFYTNATPPYGFGSFGAYELSPFAVEPYGFGGGVPQGPSFLGQGGVPQGRSFLGSNGQSSNGGQVSDAPAPSQQADSVPDRFNPGEFYLRRDRGPIAGAENLSSDLDDIRKAWLNGDYTRLQSHFTTGAKVRVFPNGRYKYSVDTGEFLSMVKEAMTRIDTIAFEFDAPGTVVGDRALATGKHTFVESDKSRQSTYVSYGFQRIDGAWKIVEAGSSSQPILKHEE